MKSWLHAFVSLSVLMLAKLAIAAPSAEVTVKGNLRPPACQPAFSSGGIVDYGVIPSASLPKGRNLILPLKEVKLSISCEGTVQLSILTKDNRASSKPSGLNLVLNQGQQDFQMFGLGIVDGKMVGAYSVVMEPSKSTGDGVETGVLYRTGPTAGWTGARAYMATNGTEHTWAPKGRSVPGAYREFGAMLGVQAVLQRPEDLWLDREVPLDGSITFEINYI